jgi:CelD/BcsL family acetyltransferase involved in cellulose biosynthesis
MGAFPSKTRKKLTREIDRIAASGLEIRYDRLRDVQTMFRMNLESFGSGSYFSDGRFLRGFETILRRLHEKHMLRITTVLVGGKIAATDLGAVWEKTYTVLAGSTSPEFPGVAKVINFHHLERACRERIRSVDFLCGDFGWKNRFRLTPRPLYEITLPAARAGEIEAGHEALAYA